METLIFLKNFILHSQPLCSLWALSFLYILYSWPQIFKFPMGGSFEIGLWLLNITASVYPFLALKQEHYWWFGLCFLIPLVIVFFWAFWMYELNSYNGEGALVMLLPVFLLIFFGAISISIYFIRHLFI